jgi:hypothetical protein
MQDKDRYPLLQCSFRNDGEKMFHGFSALITEVRRPGFRKTAKQTHVNREWKGSDLM